MKWQSGAARSENDFIGRLTVPVEVGMATRVLLRVSNFSTTIGIKVAAWNFKETPETTAELSTKDGNHASNLALAWFASQLPAS